MQDFRRPQYSKDENQAMNQPDSNYQDREPNNSLKRTRSQYEAQSIRKPSDNQNYSNFVKSGITFSMNRNNDLEKEDGQILRTQDRANRDDLNYKSNQRTIYNVGKYNDVPFEPQIINQTFKVPNEPSSFRISNELNQSRISNNPNQNTQTNRTKIPENNQTSNYHRSYQINTGINTRNKVNPSGRQIQEIPVNNYNQRNNISEFALNDNSNRGYFFSPVKLIMKPFSSWKNEYNYTIGIISGILGVGFMAYYCYNNYSISEYLPDSKKSYLMFVAVLIIGVIVYIYIQNNKNKEDDELMVNEDYQELKYLLSKQMNKDDSFLGIFLDFFIRNRTEYWNIPKEKYEKRVLKLLQKKIREENCIKECEVLVSNQTLKLWRPLTKNE